MHSYADRRTHDFFHQRDYPDLGILDKIAAKLTAEPCQADDLRNDLELDADVFSRALEKLVAHRGAVIDYEGNVIAGSDQWRRSYAAQSSFHEQQIEKVMRYAEGGRCRMGALVEHSGDVGDAARRCNLSDFCAPGEAIAQTFRPLTASEKRSVLDIFDALRPVQGMSTGKLHKQLFPREQMERDDFEALLASMARGGYAKLEDATFESDGRTVNYRRVSLTEEGEELHSALDLHLYIPDSSGATIPRNRSTSKRSKPAKSNPQSAKQEIEMTAVELELEKELKAWRLEEAKRGKFPPYCVMSDKTLRTIALDRPKTIEDLLQVNGIGPAKAAKFGERICAICTANS
jgi:superfamily II DNA helicase RecQ